MEEQILKTLKENNYPLGELDDDEQAAKDITEMVMEFIEWKDDSTTLITVIDGMKCMRYGYNGGTWELPVIFDYWFNNIRNK
jgi:hypothetical protein